MSRYCQTCKHFMGEVMRGDGEPMSDRGVCNDPERPRGLVDADDWCNDYREAAWAARKRKEGGAE